MSSEIPKSSKLYTQRQHIISSLSLFIQQLLVTDYFLSPSLFILLCRFIAQMQCARPRSIDTSKTLRFFWGIALVCNLPALYSHGRHGPSSGKAVVLDFVGLLYTPSKAQILALDLVILGLQLLLTTLAYEVHTSQFSPTSGVRDPLLPPIPPRTPSPPRPSSYDLTDDPERQVLFASPSDDELDDVDLEEVAPRSDFARQLDEDKERHRRQQEDGDEDGYVLDLRLQAVFQRLSTTAPATWAGSSAHPYGITNGSGAPLLPVTSTGENTNAPSNTNSQVPIVRPGGGLRGSTPASAARSASSGAGGISWSSLLRNHQAASAMGRRRLLEELESGLADGAEGEGPPRTR